MNDPEMLERLTLLTKGMQYVGWCNDVSALLEENKCLQGMPHVGLLLRCQDAEEQRDGLLVAAKVNGLAFTKLHQKIAQLETSIKVVLAKLLIHKEYATPDQLRGAMREAVKILQ